MAKTYRPYVPKQDFLLPPSLREWLPEDHLAYFVSDLVDQLDLSAITTVYEEEDRGYPPYHPVMLTKVLVYAYCVGVFSSRKIQRRLIEDVPFRVLAAGQRTGLSNDCRFSQAAPGGYIRPRCHRSCRVASSSRCSRTSFRSAANSGSMRARSIVNARRAAAARSRNAMAVSASPLSAWAAAA